MIGQRDIIKFFADEGCTGIQIHWCLQDHYGESTMSRSEVYRWIRDIKRRRTDLETISSPGRTPDERLSEVIRHRIEVDPHSSAQKIAHSRESAISAVCHPPPTCTEDEMFPSQIGSAHINSDLKLARKQVRTPMLEITARQTASSFRFLFTRNESWLLFAY
jgi:hypothetical protein